MLTNPLTHCKTHLLRTASTDSERHPPTINGTHQPRTASTDSERHPPTQNGIHRLGTAPTNLERHPPTRNGTHQPRTAPTDSERHPPTQNSTHQPRTAPTDSERHTPTQNGTHQPRTAPTDSERHPPTQNATHRLKTAPKDSYLTTANVNYDTTVLQQPPQMLEDGAVRQIKTHAHKMHYSQYKTDVLPCTPRASLLYNFVVVWVDWNNFCFVLWLFAITVMSSFWRYLFIGIALLTCSKTWPVGIDLCSICYYFHGNVSPDAADLLHYLDVRTATLKLMSTRTCCETYIDVKLLLI